MSKMTEQELPDHLMVEHCDCSSCPGFVVEWESDWASRFLVSLPIKAMGVIIADVSLCEVCEDSMDRDG